MSTSFPKKILTILIAFGALHSPLLAAPKKNNGAHPAPSAGEVNGSPKVVRGGFCKVVVRGIVMPRDSAEFKIHRGPQNGSLEGPVLEGNDTAVYTYRHNGKKGAESDRIDFKIKTGPNKTWSPLIASIAIEEPPSRVELIDSQLDFGSVPIGQTRSAYLQVRNGGGGILRGSLETGKPWSIDDSAEFELAEGEARDFRVVFSPDGPGERQGRLDVLAGSGKQPVILRGEGVYRFDAPERIAFKPDGVGEILEIPLTNLVDLELPLSISLPEPLVGGSSMNLPARGAAALRLEVQKRHYTEKFVEVSVADGSAVKTIRVILPSPPALLEWASEGGEVDLGEIPLRHNPRPEFELRNSGATEATVRLREDSGGLALAPGQPDTFLLRPGETAVVKTVWRLPEKPGEATARLIASHGGLDHSLNLWAIVSVAQAEEKKSVTAPRVASAHTMNASASPQILTEAEQKELKQRLPFDIQFLLTPVGGAARAEVAWKYIGPEPILFWLEKKVVERDEAGLGDAFERRLQVPGELPKPETVVKWVRVSDDEAGIRLRENGAWAGTVGGLDEGFHELRIGVRAPPGGPRIDYSSFVVRVPPLPLNPLWNWIAGFFGIFCVLYLVRKKILRFLGQEIES